jgi:tetratricopeptide (TPR) repeat protein
MLEGLVRFEKWDEAEKLLATLARENRCAGSTCLVAHALISRKRGRVAESADYTRKAAETLGKVPLSAWFTNELGVLLYKQADKQLEGRKETLRTAERAFRLAQEEYDGKASNIRYNLATTLTKLGRQDEARRILKQIDDEGGILLDANMAILGEVRFPGMN